jgi:hypothetical protein
MSPSMSPHLSPSPGSRTPAEWLPPPGPTATGGFGETAASLGGATGGAFEGARGGELLANVKRVAWLTPPGTTETAISRSEPWTPGAPSFPSPGGGDKAGAPPSGEGRLTGQPHWMNVGTPPSTGVHWARPGMREELRGLKMSALRKRAGAAGINQAQLDACDDSGNPREALTSFIVEAPPLALPCPALPSLLPLPSSCPSPALSPCLKSSHLMALDI